MEVNSKNDKMLYLLGKLVDSRKVSSMMSYTIRDENFGDIDWRSFDFSKLKFENCHFDRADMRMVRFDDTIFTNCTFNETKMNHATFDHCSFISCRLNSVTSDNAVFTHCIVRHSRLVNCQMQWCDFSKSGMDRTTFISCVLGSSKFNDFSLSACHLVDSTVTNGHFNNAQFKAVEFINARFAEATFDNCTFISEAKWTRFEGCRFESCDLSCLVSNGAKFVFCEWIDTTPNTMNAEMLGYKILDYFDSEYNEQRIRQDILFACSALIATAEDGRYCLNYWTEHLPADTRDKMLMAIADSDSPIGFLYRFFAMIDFEQTSFDEETESAIVVAIAAFIEKYHDMFGPKVSWNPDQIRQPYRLERHVEEMNLIIGKLNNTEQFLKLRVDPAITRNPHEYDDDDNYVPYPDDEDYDEDYG